MLSIKLFGVCVNVHDVEDDDSDESDASLELPGQVCYPVCGKSRPYTQCKCDTHNIFLFFSAVPRQSVVGCGACCTSLSVFTTASML